MVLVDAVCKVVFMMQAPRGVVGCLDAANFQATTPHGLHGFFG
jgi:hypothetical protein